MDYPNLTCPMNPTLPSPYRIGVYHNPKYSIYHTISYRRPTGGESYGLANNLAAQPPGGFNISYHFRPPHAPQLFYRFRRNSSIYRTPRRRRFYRPGKFSGRPDLTLYLFFSRAQVAPFRLFQPFTDFPFQTSWVGWGGIASITRRARLDTVTRLTMEDRPRLPGLVSLVSLVVVVILARLVCIFSPPIHSMNRSRTEHTSLSLRDRPSSHTSRPTQCNLPTQPSHPVSISSHGSIVILVSLPAVFSLTIIVGLVILAIPFQPIHPSVSRQSRHSIISSRLSRDTQSILPSEYNLSVAGAGGCLASPLKSNNPTQSREDNRSTHPMLPNRIFHNTQSRIHYRKIDKPCNGWREAAL